MAVKDGVVTLSGYVSTDWEKDAAEQAVIRGLLPAGSAALLSGKIILKVQLEVRRRT